MQSFVGELGHNFLEFLESNGFVGGSLVVDVSAVEHFKKFIIIDAILNPSCNCLELLVVNYSVLIGIVDSENPLKSFFGLEVSNS
jgi:hypothetical protein